MSQLQPKVLTQVGHYDRVEWAGHNTSGYFPFGDNVLLLPDQPASEVNGVMLTPDTIERIGEAAETGMIVAVGDGAWYWNSDRTRRYEGRKPTPGERVVFERYAGQKHNGNDGYIYRLLPDKCIAALVIDGEEPSVPVREAHAEAAQELQDALVGEPYMALEDPLAPPELPDLPVPIEVVAAPRRSEYPKYTVTGGVLVMAFSPVDMREKGDGPWFSTEKEARDEYDKSLATMVSNLMKALKDR